MRTHKSIPMAAALLAAIISSSTFSFADEEVWNVVTDKGVDRSNARNRVDNILGDAWRYLSTHANKTLVLYFPGGADYVFEHVGEKAIKIDNFNFASSNLVLRGDGAGSTTLRFNQYDQQGILIRDSSRVTIEQMHLTRDKHYVSQGSVVSVEQGKVTFQVHPGFPDPQWLFDNSLEHDRDGQPAQRTLLGFRGSDLDPELDPAFGAIVLSGMTCGIDEKCEATLKNDDHTPNWQSGQQVAFRSKVGESTIFVTNSDDIIVQDVRFTRMSLGPIRFTNGCDGPILRRVSVDRSDDIINGHVPFYSAPAGGPQIDTATRGPTVQDCTIVGAGDDGIAVFTDNDATTPTSGTLIEGNTIRDNQARGILLNGGDGSIQRNICRNNTLIRNEMASIVVGQVSNDWDIYDNTFIQSWIDPVIMLDGSSATLHQNIRIFNNWFFEAPKNNHLILVNNTDNLEIYNNTILSFSNEEDHNELGTGDSLVYVMAGEDVQGWGNTYPQGTSRTPTAFESSTSNVNVEWYAAPTPMRETVPVAEDTYVNSNAPDSINGEQTYLKIQRGGGRSFLGLVKFNINGVIAENAAVLSARLKLPVHSSTYSLVDPQVYACLDNGWSESTVTYRNKPAIAELLDSQLGTFNAPTTVEFDLTNKVTTDGIYSFYLWNGTNNVGYYSTKENTTYGGATMEVTTYAPVTPYTPGQNPPFFSDVQLVKPIANQDNAYTASIALDAWDFDGDITSFSKIYGPAWLSVSAEGTLSGMPSNNDTGENRFLVRVTDAQDHYADAMVKIHVNGVADCVPIANDDGFVLESSETSNIGGSENATGPGLAAIRLGDDANNKQYKAVVSFDTSGIPDGATILSATLQLKRGMVVGDPSGFGAITVDIQGDNGFFGSTALENQDFQASATASSVATLPYPSNDGSWSEVSLNAAGLAAINKIGSTQLRLGFATDDDNDGTADYLGFYSGDNSTVANRPKLVIVYH